MPQGPLRATQEFSILRRANSLEVIPSQAPAVTKIDKKIKRHKRSSSLGTNELKEKLRRSLQKEKKQPASSQAVHGGLHNIRDVLYRDQCHINPALPVFGLSRTRSFDCLSELENLTLSRSPLTPHEGHKAPLPSNEMTGFICRRSTQTPEEDVSPPTYSPPTYSPLYYVDARSPTIESPDQYKIGSSPRVNCSFLFAQQPPASAAQATCVKGSSLESLESSAPDKSKIKIIFSSNSVFNRPPPPANSVFNRPPPPAITKHSPAEQACK